MSDSNSPALRQVPIRLVTGETWMLIQKGEYYCCPVCGEWPFDEPPFSTFESEVEGTWDFSSSHALCLGCWTEFGLELSIMGASLADIEENVLACRLTWLCKNDWPAEGLLRLRENLGVTDETIRDYERMAGKSHGLDQRFRPRKLSRKERKKSQQQWAGVTCPCCGHLSAFANLFNYCGYCGWRYVPEQELAPDSSHPMSPVTFRTAQKNYALFGAITPEIGAVIHEPEFDYGIDPEWQPLPP